MSTMQRWNPARDFARLQDEVNRLFDGSLGITRSTESYGWTPAVDVFEDTEGVTFKFDLPEVDAAPGGEPHARARRDLRSVPSPAGPGNHARGPGRGAARTGHGRSPGGRAGRGPRARATLSATSHGGAIPLGTRRRPPGALPLRPRRGPSRRVRPPRRRAHEERDPAQGCGAHRARPLDPGRLTRSLVALTLKAREVRVAPGGSGAP